MFGCGGVVFVGLVGVGVLCTVWGALICTAGVVGVEGAGLDTGWEGV